MWGIVMGIDAGEHPCGALGIKGFIFALTYNLHISMVVNIVLLLL